MVAADAVMMVLTMFVVMIVMFVFGHDILSLRRYDGYGWEGLCVLEFQ